MSEPSHAHNWLTAIVGGAAATIMAAIILYPFGNGSADEGSKPASPPITTPSATAEPTTPEPTPSALPTAGSPPIFLADLANIGGAYAESGGMDISGQSYPRSVKAQCDSFAGPLEYNLGKRGALLTGELGLPDDSSGNSIHDIVIYGDDRVLLSTSVSLGHPKKLHVDVHGVLRLKFGCTERPNSPTAGGSGDDTALGNAAISIK